MKRSDFILGLLVGALAATALFAFIGRKQLGEAGEASVLGRDLKIAHSLPTSHPVHRGIERFAQRLKELSGGQGQRERALMMWSRGSVAAAGVAEAAELEGAFDRWGAEGGITTIGEYEITGSRSEEGSSPAATIVSGSVDGRSFELRVVSQRPLEWVVTPGAAEGG